MGAMVVSSVHRLGSDKQRLHPGFSSWVFGNLAPDHIELLPVVFRPIEPDAMLIRDDLVAAASGFPAHQPVRCIPSGAHRSISLSCGSSTTSPPPGSAIGQPGPSRARVC